jgi:phage gpG-like protein
VIRGRTHFDARKIDRAARKASITSLGHAAAAIRKAARKSIRRRKRPSRPGQPPSSPKGKLKRARAILYAVDKHKQAAVIGPTATMMGQAAAAHEHGGRYKQQDYPARPFMRPALQETAPRLPRHWAGSIKR